MKILLVSNMYPSKKYRHYGVFVQNTEKVLHQMPNVLIRKVVMKKCDGKLKKLMTYLLFYCGIILHGVFGGYDVIYAHFISHTALPLQIVRALNKKTKIVLNAHGNDVVADVPEDEKWVKLSHEIVPKAEHIVVPSAYYREVMMRDFGRERDGITVYPSGGIDQRVFCPQDRDGLVGKYGLNKNCRYIGYVSRIEADKGWDTFLEMVKALKDQPNLGFIVVGDGAEKDAFNALAERLNVADKLLCYPLLQQSQIAEMFNILDVFCFPTRRKSESLGLVGLEAMACGCTVVASDAGGPSSYMKDGENGYVFPAVSAAALADRVRAALAATDEEKELLREGMRETVKRYSRESVNSILLDLFENIRSSLRES